MELVIYNPLPSRTQILIRFFFMDLFIYLFPSPTFYSLQVGLQLEEAMTSSQFEGLLTTLGGYVIIAAFLVLFYYVFSVLHLHRIKRVFGFCYVVVKVKRNSNSRE